MLARKKTCRVVARSLRLRVLFKTLDTIDKPTELGTWLSIFLPEIVLSFCDSNQKARKASASLILKLC